MIFVRREIVLLAIDCSPRRREEKFSHAARSTMLEQIERAQDIDRRIESRVIHRFPDIHLCSMVYDHVEPFVGKDFLCRFIANINLEKFCFWGNISTFAGRKMVDDYDIVSCGDACIRNMRGNESGTTG